MKKEIQPVKRGFMCAVDWACELGEAMDGSTIYPSSRCNGRMCLDECGVVEVEVRYVRTVKRGVGTPIRKIPEKMVKERP